MILLKNIRSSEEINAIGATGTVEVSFEVMQDGCVANFEIKKSLSSETDAEALRVVKLSPKWQPVEKQENVIARSSVPVQFPNTKP